MGHNRRTKALILGLAGAGLLVATQAVAAPAPLDPPIAPAEVARTTDKNINDNDLYCLTLAVFFEGGSTYETEEGQRHIARVVNLRAKAGRRVWGGSDICDVVFYNRRGVCQFTFACLPLARRSPIRGPSWRYSREIAEDEIEGRSDVHALFIRYYMNPKLTSDRNACRFRREFVPVLIAGRHHFFREPLPWERRAVATGEYEECERQMKAEAAAKAKAAARAKAAAAKKASRQATKPTAKKPEQLATNP
jgi:hypothetical protein